MARRLALSQALAAASVLKTVKMGKFDAEKLQCASPLFDEQCQGEMWKSTRSWCESRIWLHQSMQGSYEL